MANFYFCESCGNLFYSINKASVNCCGRTWEALPVSQDPNDKHKLDIAVEGNMRVITMHHPQTEEHYFTFIAFVEDGKVTMQAYKPNEEVKFLLHADRHGKLYWHCNLHGMYELEI